MTKARHAMQLILVYISYMHRSDAPITAGSIGLKTSAHTLLPLKTNQYVAETMVRNLQKLLKKSVVVAKIAQIRNRDFSIIASNCTGTLPYRFLNIPYSTPTVNLFFYAPDYLQFVKHLDYYLTVPLRFSNTSKFSQGRSTHAMHGHYPIGRLEDIEIHFMHYLNESDAAQKWERRKKRINHNNLILAMTDRDLCSEQIMSEFDALPFARKFILTSRHHSDIDCALPVHAFGGQSEIGDAYTHYDSLAHLDFRAMYDSPQESTTRTRNTIRPESIA